VVVWLTDALTGCSRDLIEAPAMHFTTRTYKTHEKPQ
jgi:hypothetical protein